MSLLVDIEKKLGDFTLKVAFEAGDDVVGLLGASGCGKSMTLKCIAGVVKPDRGTIAVGGRTLFDSARKINLSPQERRVGLLFQNYALFPNMTARQNIEAVLIRARRGDAAGTAKRLASLMERFYLRGLENHYPANLSGGQQQRVALARILASDPEILMLDEPLSALDSYLRWQLEEELMDMFAAFGGTTLYVSHNRDEVYRLCGSVCAMRGGANEPVRAVRAFFEQPETLAASLLSGCKNHSRALRADDGTIQALDWGVRLRCAAPAGADARYVGVRAHDVKICGGGSGESIGENTFPCLVTRVVQDVFSTVVSLSPERAGAGGFARIRMELPREAARAIRAGDRLWIRVDPADVMPLRE